MKNVEDIYPLTPTQAGILFHTLQAPNSGVYFQQYTCELVGSINIGIFQRVWEDAIGRHPVLRTAFVWEGLDEPLQVVRQKVDVPFEAEDWRAVDSDQQQEQLKRFLQKDRQQGYNLGKAPLMRLHLFHTAPDRHQFVWSWHHLLTDGWSSAIILKEVFATYQALCRGQSPKLSQPRPFRDYIAWLQKQDASQAEAFWRRELQGFDAPTSLRVNKRPEKQSQYENSYHDYTCTLSNQTTVTLVKLARMHRITLSSILQGAWAILLSRYSGESDVLYGATVSGRPSELPGVEDMVGMFINTLPVRVQVDPDIKLVDWLKAQQTHLLELRQYEYSSVADIRNWSEVPRGQPLFDSIVVFENYPTDSSVLGNKRHAMEVRNTRYIEQSNYPLSLIVIPHTPLTLRVIFDQNHYEDETIARLTGHLQNLLESASKNLDQSIDGLQLLSNPEQQKLLIEWNRTKVDCPQNLLIHRLFEEHVKATPDRIGVEDTENRLTFGELDHRANQLARHLQQLGIKADTTVGLVLERSIDMIVAILGVLKAGGAYLPLDPAYPQERLAFMLADVKAPVVLTHKRLAESLPQHDANTVLIDAEWDLIANKDSTSPNVGTIPDNLAYVIYTSGSTGVPKGVPVSHQNLVHSTTARFHFYERSVDRFLLLSSFAFDSSMVGIFATLCQGGSLILPAPGDERDVQKLADLIDQHQITDTLCLPSMYDLILTNAKAHQLDSLKTVIVAGEACSQALIQRHYERLPQTAIYNEYGPTEATVWSTVYRVPVTGSGMPVPIGRPIANTKVFILDGHYQPVPIGVPGELYIGGDGLARGYLNQPGRTAESFVPSPFQNESDSRLYKTGDLARYLSDGNIQFLGRVDHQIKVRGYRVELDEIQLALNQHPQVRENAVVALESERGQQLAAYFVPASVSVPHSEQLRSFLRARLPDYMLPTAFVSLESLPLTPNGKVDRQALPRPDQVSEAEVDAFVPPHTDTEAIIAQIWSGLLGLERVGRHEDFFSLGGHSLLVMQLVVRLRNAFEVELPVNSVFEKPTLAGTAEQIETLLWAKHSNQWPTRAQADSEREEFEV